MLLPHRCTIACDKYIHRQSNISVALSTDSRRPEFLRESVLGCTDFPHSVERDYPAAFLVLNFHNYNKNGSIKEPFYMIYKNILRNSGFCFFHQHRECFFIINSKVCKHFSVYDYVSFFASVNKS